MKSIPSPLLQLVLIAIHCIYAADVIPAPIVVPPSQFFQGVDGSWSTFFARVGTPAQVVRLIAATNSPDTIVVRPEGCLLSANPKGIPPNCVSTRGEAFNSNLSSTWIEQGWFGLNGGEGGYEANLGYSFNTLYGLDTLGLGQQSSDAPTLQNQTVAGFQPSKPLYLGLFGLGTQPVIYENFGNISVDSYFVSLRKQLLIPSLSWSYTQGASYQLSAGQFAQLIFGGFDSSRFLANDVTFPLSADVTRDIVVGVQSIFYSGTSTAPLLKEPIYAFIESTDPNIWLPLSACQLFEQAFGLEYDSTTQKYLLNTTQYTALSAANPSVTFRLAATTSGGATVDIKLPFNAFGLKAAYPFVPNATYYFPLQRAANSTQYTLGRTFLQEAYLTVDYERKNFSVSQATFNQASSSVIHPILSPAYNTSSNSSSDHLTESTSNSTPIGPIVGGVVGGLAVLALIGGIIFWYIRRKKSKEADTANTNANIPTIGTPLQDLKKPDFGNTYEAHSEAGSIYKKTATSIYTTRPADAELSGPEIQGTGELPADGHGIYQMHAGEQRAEMGGSERTYELDGGEPVELAGNQSHFNPKRGSGGSDNLALRDVGGRLSPMGHSNSVGSMSSASGLIGRQTPSPLSRKGVPSPRGQSPRSAGGSVVSPLMTPKMSYQSPGYDSPGR